MIIVTDGGGCDDKSNGWRLVVVVMIVTDSDGFDVKSDRWWCL